MTNQTQKIEPGETFDTGTPVNKGGVYVCSPCGYKKHLEAGGTFPECDSCVKDDNVDPDEQGAPSGIWEYVSDEAEADEMSDV